MRSEVHENFAYGTSNVAIIFGDKAEMLGLLVVGGGMVGSAHCSIRLDGAADVIGLCTGLQEAAAEVIGAGAGVVSFANDFG